MKDRSSVCRCGTPITATAKRCRQCLGKLSRGKVKAYHPQFASKITYGKHSQPSPCPFSYWAEPLLQQHPDLFYAVNRARASETKGRERIAE